MCYCSALAHIAHRPHSRLGAAKSHPVWPAKETSNCAPLRLAQTRPSACRRQSRDPPPSVVGQPRHPRRPDPRVGAPLPRRVPFRPGRHRLPKVVLAADPAGHHPADAPQEGRPRLRVHLDARGLAAARQHRAHRRRAARAVPGTLHGQRGLPLRRAEHRLGEGSPEGRRRGEDRRRAAVPAAHLEHDGHRLPPRLRVGRRAGARRAGHRPRDSGDGSRLHPGAGRPLLRGDRQRTNAPRPHRHLSTASPSATTATSAGPTPPTAATPPPRCYQPSTGRWRNRPSRSRASLDRRSG